MHVRRNIFIPLAIVFALALPGWAAEKSEPSSPLSIHMISGSREYKSEPSLRAFADYLESNYKIECTASWGHDGIKQLENLDKLESADLLIVFARRMKLSEPQMETIRKHWQAGKPVIGIRTASHAFGKDDNAVFDRQVLGNNYTGHYGGETVEVTNVDAAKGHPVLEGVGSFKSRKLYKTGDLPETTTVLQYGDIGKARHPVTMINEYEGGRVFYTSLGVPEDFQDENFRQMLVNAIGWSTERAPKTLAK